MDRKDDIYGKNLKELDSVGLAALCANVAIHHSANRTQNDTAHALRMEWVRLSLDYSPGHGRNEAEVSLRKRMKEFLSGVPHWMTGGI